MAKAELGFSHGSPENPETRWEKKLDDGSTVIYIQTRRKDGFFGYDCEWHRGYESKKVSESSPVELAPEEIEQLPRFLDLLAGKI